MEKHRRLWWSENRGGLRTEADEKMGNIWTSGVREQVGVGRTEEMTDTQLITENKQHVK